MAESNLALGRVVVIDAVNDSEAARDTWRRAASNTKVTLKFAVLTCSNLMSTVGVWRGGTVDSRACQSRVMVAGGAEPLPTCTLEIRASRSRCA